MAADSSPSRSHTCLRPPQCPLRTLQFIGPPFLFHDELRVAQTGPKSRRHRRPELLAPLEAGVILTWVHWITPKDGRDGRWLGELQWSKANLPRSGSHGTVANFRVRYI